MSKPLCAINKFLSIYEKEFLALIMAVKRWRSYFQRQNFVIRTDHKSLAYLNEFGISQCKTMTRLMGL
jgi:hypothetical protein